MAEKRYSMVLDLGPQATREFGQLEGAMGATTVGQVVGHALGLLSDLVSVRKRGGRVLLYENGQLMEVNLHAPLAKVSPLP